MPDLSSLFSKAGFLKWDGAGNAASDFGTEDESDLAASPEMIAAFAPARIAAATPVTKVDSNFGFKSNGVWKDVDAGGTADARPLDLVIPAVAGDIIYVEPNIVLGNQAVDAYFDVATVVAGAVVNTFSGATAGGIGGWFAPTSIVYGVTGAAPYTVTAGDIEDGAVRCRLRGKSGADVNRTIYAASDSWPLKIGGGNAGPPA